MIGINICKFPLFNSRIVSPPFSPSPPFCRTSASLPPFPWLPLFPTKNIESPLHNHITRYSVSRWANWLTNKIHMAKKTKSNETCPALAWSKQWNDWQAYFPWKKIVETINQTWSTHPITVVGESKYRQRWIRYRILMMRYKQHLLMFKKLKYVHVKSP